MTIIIIIITLNIILIIIIILYFFSRRTSEEKIILSSFFRRTSEEKTSFGRASKRDNRADKNSEWIMIFICVFRWLCANYDQKVALASQHASNPVTGAGTGTTPVLRQLVAGVANFLRQSFVRTHLSSGMYCSRSTPSMSRMN